MSHLVDSPDQVRRGLESLWLRQLLRETRLGAGLLGETSGFAEVLEGALADALAEGGGLGLSSAVELGELAAARAARPAAAEPGVVRSAFGRRLDPIDGTSRRHDGVDLAAPAGTPVEPPRAGTVTHAGPAGSYGNLVVIDHGAGLETRYAHLSAVDVQVGERVGPGQALGRVGSTGRSTGPHLHYEVRIHAAPTDPTWLPPTLGPAPPLKAPALRSNPGGEE